MQAIVGPAKRHVIVRGVQFAAGGATRTLGRIEIEDHSGRRVWACPWRRDRIYQSAKAPADTRHLGDGIALDLVRVLDEFGVTDVELIFAGPAVTLTGALDLWREARRNGRIVSSAWGSQAHVRLRDLAGGDIIARVLAEPAVRVLSLMPGAEAAR